MTETKETKERVLFKFADKRPYAGLLLQLIVRCVILMVAASLAAGFLFIIADKIWTLPDKNSQTILYNSIFVVMALVALFIQGQLWKPQFSGYVKGADNSLLWKCAIVMVVYLIICGLEIAIFSDFEIFGLSAFVNACYAGVVEEIVFRIIPLTFAMRHCTDRKYVIFSVVLTSAAFGIVHMSNLYMGADIGITVFQSVFGMFIGIFFAACYVRTGNIWITIVAHAVNDMVAGCDAAAVSENLVYKTQLGIVNILDGIFVLVLTAIGCYWLRKSKHDEIVAVWSRKWPAINRQ